MTHHRAIRQRVFNQLRYFRFPPVETSTDFGVKLQIWDHFGSNFKIEANSANKS